MRTRFACWSPLAPADVRDHLRDAIAAGALAGWVDDDEGFRVSRALPRRNSWRPRLTGTLRAAAGGTLVEARLDVHPLVLAFTVVHGVFFVGLTWLLGVVAFSWEVDASCDALADAVGATLRGADALAVLAGDPRLPGAEVNAPPALRARIGERGVTFEVAGPTGHPHETVRIEVDAAEVELREGARHLRIAWDDLRGGSYERDPHRIVLVTAAGDHAFPCHGLAPADAEWLRDYLVAQAERRRLSPEERDRQDAERARLARLTGRLRER